MSIDYIKLWKEFFILFLLSVFFIEKKFKYNKNKLILFNLIIIFLIIQLIISTASVIVIYQIKLDVLPALFFISAFFYFKRYNTEELLEWLVKIIVVLGIVNAAFNISEAVFFSNYLKLMNVSDGDWGVHNGIRIITHSGLLRTPGIFTGFVQSGTLTLLAYTLFIYYRKRLNLNKLFKFFVLLVLIVGIVVSTYKTSILGLGFISFLYFINTKLHVKRKYFVTFGLSLSIFLLFLFTSFNYWFFDIVKGFDYKMAYNSIYLRVEQHLDIFHSVKTIPELLFGVGYGVNGTFGLDKLKYGIIALPTDSTFIYLFSNYGLFGLLGFFLFIVFFIYKFRHNNIYSNAVLSYLLYILTLEFFFNNIIVNFPMIYLLSLLIIFTYYLPKERLYDTS